MFESLWRVFAPCVLVPSVLPFRLLEKYGSSGFYTSAQVRQVVKELKLTGASARMGFAAASSSDEFLKAQPTLTLDEYISLRAEFMDLIGIDRSRFDMVDARRLSRRHRQEWARAPLTDHVTGVWG